MGRQWEPWTSKCTSNSRLTSLPTSSQRPFSKAQVPIPASSCRQLPPSRSAPWLFRQKWLQDCLPEDTVWDVQGVKMQFKKYLLNYVNCTVECTHVLGPVPPTQEVLSDRQSCPSCLSLTLFSGENNTFLQRFSWKYCKRFSLEL